MADFFVINFESTAFFVCFGGFLLLFALRVIAERLHNSIILALIFREEEEFGLVNLHIQGDNNITYY